MYVLVVLDHSIPLAQSSVVLHTCWIEYVWHWWLLQSIKAARQVLKRRMSALKFYDHPIHELLTVRVDKQIDHPSSFLAQMSIHIRPWC